jgi:hypothetical protein
LLLGHLEVSDSLGFISRPAHSFIRRFIPHRAGADKLSEVIPTASPELELEPGHRKIKIPAVCAELAALRARS